MRKSPLHILICDDHPICQAGIEYHLRETFTQPMLLKKVGSRKDLLFELRQPNDFQILFLDLQLPDVHGLGLVDEVIDSFPHLKVIVVTSCEDRIILERLRHATRSRRIGAVLWKSHSLESFEKALKALEPEGASYLGPDLEKSLEASFRPSDLTPREWEVLELIAQGLTNEKIAQTLGCAIETVKTHRARLGQKTSSRNRAELTAWYLQRYSKSSPSSL